MKVNLRKILTLLMLVLIVSPSLAIIVGAVPLTVDTDRTYYSPEEDVEIYGTADAEASVTILVNDPQGTTICDDDVSVDKGGKYSITLMLSEDTPAGIYTVTASTDSATAQTSFMVTLMDLQTLAESLLSLVENCRAQVEAEFDRLEAKGIEIPDEAEESFKQGFGAMTEALQLLMDGDYSGAVDKARQALQYFKDAFHLILGMYPEEPYEDAEKEAEEAVGLRAVIERAHTFLDKVKATADRLEEEGGYDVSYIKERLVEADETLARAEELLDSGDITSAAQELATSQSILDRTMGLIDSTAKRMKVMMVERFLEKVQKRIHGLDDKIDRLRNRLTAEKIFRTNLALRAVEMKLQGIRERIAEGDVEDAVDELSDAIEEIDEGLEELNGFGISIALEAINKLEGRIRVLEVTAGRLEEEGLDISEIEEELQSVEDLLSEMMARLEEGDPDAAEELLEEAEELLESAEEHLEDSQKKIWGKKGSRIIEKVRKWIEKVREWRPEEDEED